MKNSDELKVKRRVFIRRIRKWYKLNRRDFAWRKTENPYFLTIAEVLLQKTNAEKAESAYKVIIKRYKNPARLASANKSELESILQNIGLIGRVDTLISVGRFFSLHKESTVTPSELMEIKGLGKYMSNSVVIHSSGARLPLLDPNIIRIYSRVFDIESKSSRPRCDNKLWESSQALLPRDNISEYFYALLDFGAMICTARNPKCLTCTVGKGICSYNLYESE